jgi:hypothetical protein
LKVPQTASSILGVYIHRYDIIDIESLFLESNNVYVVLYKARQGRKNSFFHKLESLFFGLPHNNLRLFWCRLTIFHKKNLLCLKLIHETKDQVQFCSFETFLE